MSLIQLPPKPTGTGPQAEFMRWVWESINLLSRVNDVQGVVTQRTTKGTALIPVNTTKKGGDTPAPSIPRWG